MPNRNYINGRTKEYKIMNRFKKQGYDIVFRSAGSHSPIDVIAINLKTLEIDFVQSKPKSMSDKKKKEIEKINEKLNNEFLTRFKVE